MNNAAKKQDILDAANTNRVYGKMGKNESPGALLTSDARSFILDELKQGVTAIEITPIGLIRHYDKRSAYPTDDLPIPYTLTDKAREYFERGKTS